jgi:DNA modification methylase
MERMKEIESGSVDMILTDLPYGTTQNKWDAVIPFEPMWREFWRVCRGAVVLTASQPFTSALVMSNRDAFRYGWVWEKPKATGHLDARRKPLKAHEDVLVFYRAYPTYNPQMGEGKPYKNNHKPGDAGECYGEVKAYSFDNKGTRFPRSVVRFTHETKPQHPTAKPVALLEYLIRTYTNEGQAVLDATMGSGSTGVAAANTGRQFIGIERDPTYFKIAESRIAEAAGHSGLPQLPLSFAEEARQG